MEFARVSVVSCVAVLVVAGLCHVSRTTGLTQLFSTCSLILPSALFTGQQEGSKKKAQIMQGPSIPGSEKV